MASNLLSRITQEGDYLFLDGRRVTEIVRITGAGSENCDHVWLANTNGTDAACQECCKCGNSVSAYFGAVESARAKSPQNGPYEAVRELRQHLGDNQQGFAVRLGLSVRAIANYEAGRAPEAAVLVTLLRLAKSAEQQHLALQFARQLVAALGLDRGELGLLTKVLEKRT